ncbi:MAG TPA: J domain-containing protein, partial [Candidatus Dormibacteraeota bacterium]|nr:J domain-containing protein [Candidatus Dormibacteraeota bacterium]
VATGWWIYTQWQRRPRLPPSGPASAGEAGWDPYDVLDVRRGASRDEITRAYREQMKRYHPDRVSGLGDELQEVAHRKTLEIQRAYAELGGH